MSSLDKARETQLHNIETKTGKKLSELRALIAASGLTKHGEIRDMLKTKLGLGHGDANALVHYALSSDGQSAAEAAGATADDAVSQIYTGAKEHLRPIHDKLVAEIDKLGTYEAVPKKGYISYRRKKQFTMIGPATKERVEVGLNMKGVEGTDRLIAQPPGGMCQYKVNVTDPKQVDKELLGWIKHAYESAG